jgi:hypothetical protein
VGRPTVEKLICLLGASSTGGDARPCAAPHRAAFRIGQASMKEPTMLMEPKLSEPDALDVVSAARIAQLVEEVGVRKVNLPLIPRLSG